MQTITAFPLNTLLFQVNVLMALKKRRIPFFAGSFCFVFPLSTIFNFHQFHEHFLQKQPFADVLHNRKNSCKKNCSLLNIYFLSTITCQFLFHFRGRRRLLPFNGAFFAQEVPKELILLCMDYDVALRLENVRKSQK